MMFQLHTAYSLELLVLAAGLTLIYFGGRQASSLLKIGGYILTISTVLNMLCTLYYGVRYWEDGYFKSPASSFCPMHKSGAGQMPEGMMMNNMMMPMDGMKKPAGMPLQKTNGATPPPTDEHHK